MINLAVFLTYLTLIIWSMHVYPTRIGRGRVFSRPFSKLIGWRPSLHSERALFRCLQILVVGVVFVILFPHTPGCWIFISYSALYVDDILTGDDERWKRLRRKAANKIKWRMELPVPAES